MNRRNFIGSSMLIMAGCATTTPSIQKAPFVGDIRTPPVVLVHGAWHGGWCWAWVESGLRAAGYRVYSPTLTGLGERAHLRYPVPGLQTHVEDVARLIEWNELHDVILVGHSYGGMIITAIADRMKHRVRHVVYLDAALPKDGDTMLSQDPAATDASVVRGEEELRSLAPDDEWMEPLPAVAFGIPADRKDLTGWVNRRLTSHPLSSWLEPVSLRNGGSEGLARTYIHCTAPALAQSSSPRHAARIRGSDRNNEWRYRELATGHDAMVTAPLSVVNEILAV